jgi:hypothetical protein
VFGKRALAILKELDQSIERFIMFKKRIDASKKITDQYKSTDELLCIYRQRAIDAMVEVMGQLKSVKTNDELLLVSPITDYVQALEALVVSTPKDFYPSSWMKQQIGQSFPPVRMTPWLNIQ